MAGDVLLIPLLDPLHIKLRDFEVYVIKVPHLLDWFLVCIASGWQCLCS